MKTIRDIAAAPFLFLGAVLFMSGLALSFIGDFIGGYSDV